MSALLSASFLAVVFGDGSFTLCVFDTVLLVMTLFTLRLLLIWACSFLPPIIEAPLDARDCASLGCWCWCWCCSLWFILLGGGGGGGTTE